MDDGKPCAHVPARRPAEIRQKGMLKWSVERMGLREAGRSGRRMDELAQNLRQGVRGDVIGSGLPG